MFQFFSPAWAAIFLLSPFLINSFLLSRNCWLLKSQRRPLSLLLQESGMSGEPENLENSKTKYVLGKSTSENNSDDAAMFWSTSSPVNKPPIQETPTQSQNNQTTMSLPNASVTKRYDLGDAKNSPVEYRVETPSKHKKMIANDAESQFLSRALWLYGENKDTNDRTEVLRHDGDLLTIDADREVSNHELEKRTSILQYKDIDLSIPLSVYNADANIDHVWALLRYEAQREAQREPLLVSFLYSTILNHSSLESALAFHLANRLSSPSMMSTQIMSLIMEALNHSPSFRRDLRVDIMAVRDRDPACTSLPDVFLHFKGFHALETHRVANFFFKTGRKTLAHYLQSQVSQNFQIDIHPNATLGNGVMLDHGTGIVIGETATVGDNCSILHHVTLGGSGKKGVDRHPKVGNGVLLGAGASVLGNIKIGDGCQVGAGTLVLQDLQPHTVAVGVPAKIIGTFQDEKAQPGQSMNQVGTKESEAMIRVVGDGI